MQSVFSRCGFLSAAVSLEHIGISYLWKLSANSSKCFTANGKPNYDTRIQLNTPSLGWRKTYSCRILTPMPWARLHPTISPSLKRKRISKLVYHFTIHHYTNNPTTKNTFIIAHVAILMAREGTLIQIQSYLFIISQPKVSFQFLILRRVPTWYLLLHTIIFIQSHILRLQMGSTTFKT